jgi:hypothetical protein
MDLYNVQSRAREDIDDPVALQEAVFNGTHAFKTGTYVPVLKNGKYAGRVPSENARKAIELGYELETDTQSKVRKYVDDQGITGGLKVALGQFADEALLGLPELVFDKTADPFEIAKKEALKKEWELTNTVFGIGGALSTLWTGAPLWRGASKVGQATTKTISEKIALLAGENASKAGVKKAAANLAGKTAGMGVEGAIVSMPRGVTELALGDPEAAAESVIAGAAIGGLFGAGLTVAKPAGKKAINLLQKLEDDYKLTDKLRMQNVQNLAKSVMRKTTAAYAGLKEEDIIKYINEADSFVDVKTLEDLVYELDGRVVSYFDNAAALKDKLDTAKRAYIATNKNLLESIKSGRAQADMSVSLLDDAAVLKEKIIQQSNLADDALIESQAQVSKETLLSWFEKVKQDYFKIAISEKAAQGAKRFDDYIARVDASFGDTVDGTGLREVLKQVRSDATWSSNFLDFNDLLNRAVKNFSHRLSNILKQGVPQYNDIMVQMAPDVEALRGLNKALGTAGKELTEPGIRQTVQDKLKGMLKAGKEPTLDAVRIFDERAGTNYVGYIDRLKRIQAAAEKVNKDVISPSLNKEGYDRVKEASRQYWEADTKLQGIKAIKDVQASIRNMGGANPSIKKRDAFRWLAEQEGKASDFYLEQFDKRRILDAFEKTAPNGSRRTAATAALGGGIGATLTALGLPIPPLVSTTLGAGAGVIADYQAGMWLKNFLDKHKSAAGALFIEQEMKKAAMRFDKIPEILDRMAKKGPGPKRPAAIEYIRRATEDKDDDSVAARMEDFRDKIAGYISDPMTMQNLMGAYHGGIARTGAPVISEKIGEVALKALDHLYEGLPKPYTMSSPFAPKYKWMPSDFEINRFARRLQVIDDPLSVLDDMESGTLTRDHMDTMKKVYPYLYQELRTRIMQEAGKDRNFSYQQRLSLSIATGADLDGSIRPASILNNQKVFMQQGEQEEAPKGQIKIDQQAQSVMQSAMEE